MRAIDNGRPQQKMNARVLFTVVEGLTESPNPPQFVDSGVRVSVTENDAIGHLVRIMSAEDPDGGKIWYSIVGKCIKEINGSKLLINGLKCYFQQDIPVCTYPSKNPISHPCIHISH